MQFQFKKFNELSLQQLYDLLQLRSEVFVVEQDCVYQDIDGKDHKAVHVLGYDCELLAAYTRIFQAGDYFDEISIGRVVVQQHYRKSNYGKLIMEASMDHAFAKAKSPIKISAQQYLERFYTDLGFEATGKKYLEDGIPHMEMIAYPKN
ncbi:GNAT family N-acetyltransferase [Nonlabens ponticola]|uniref:GNAT family N-acetyltransferase n=1 Tax=Nonlabens ponticola TaxID=2496866 RepID=A0A3S9MVK3_9FLAO|nr:GNAT family N-acetyltransferase [Nonlabens ponticola]AZQ43157.1 GNAT family N-acetyltransferase [Nonlabens ponticola]